MLRRNTRQGFKDQASIFDEIGRVVAKFDKDIGVSNTGQSHRVKVRARAE